MKTPRISYVDPVSIADAAMLAELDRCRREGTPRPESQAVRAHVPGGVLGLRQQLARRVQERRCRSRTLVCIPDPVPSVRSESGYFRSLSRRCGDGTEGEVD